MCDLVCDFLNSYASQQSNNAQHFFSFIVGMTNYHKIVVYAEKIEFVNSLSCRLLIHYQPFEKVLAILKSTFQ